MKLIQKSLLAASLLAAAPAVFAQYTMTLTGVGDGVVSNGVYVSPYVGTITQGNTPVYAGYMICDDFKTDSYLYTPWQATQSSSGGVLTGTEKFGGVTFDGTTYTAQQAYNAAGWLANQLVQPGNVTSATAQVNMGFAIWNIFDNGQASSQASVQQEEALAFTHDNQVQSNVTVYTPSLSNPNGVNQSQEFLVVNPTAAPEIDPASATGALSLLLGGFTLLRGRRRQG
jgi:hypothetical protein